MKTKNVRRNESTRGSVTCINGSVKSWTHQGTDTRFMYYTFALSLLILLYRHLASCSAVGSYCFADAACGLVAAAWISGVQ